MKLEIELLPETSWGKNLRDLLSPYRWQLVSQQVQKEADYTCEICGRKKGDIITRLNCHEVWEFDIEKRVQRLIGLQSLCFECHCCKHIGFTKTQEWIDTNKIIEHFLKINNIGYREYRQYEKEVYDLWADRCQIDWVIDYGKWSYLIEQNNSRISKKDKLNLVRDVLLENPYRSNKEIYELISPTYDISLHSTKKYASVIRKELKCLLSSHSNNQNTRS